MNSIIFRSQSAVGLLSLVRVNLICTYTQPNETASGDASSNAPHSHPSTKAAVFHNGLYLSSPKSVYTALLRDD